MHDGADSFNSLRTFRWVLLGLVYPHATKALPYSQTKVRPSISLFYFHHNRSQCYNCGLVLPGHFSPETTTTCHAMTETITSERFSALLAVHVACGRSVKNAAKLLECGESTAYRLSRTDEFKAEVARLRTDMLDSAVGEITNAASQAIRKLVALLDDPDHCLGAAKAILANVKSLSEFGEIRHRLDRLEGKQ